MDYVTIALAKGRLAEQAIEIFESIGIDCTEMKGKSRKLIFEDETHKLHFIFVKASDVPTYVEYGAADIGFVGKDTLLEAGKNLYEVLDLKFGKCKMVVAGPKERKANYQNMVNQRVATKYINIAKNHFYYTKGQTVEIIELHGSVELGPLVGLSEVIVDIVETGTTLKENGLEVFEEICDLSARMVVNRVSMKMKSGKIKWLIDEIKSKMKEESE